MVFTSIILSTLALGLSMWLGRRNPVRSSGLTAGMLVLLMLTPALLWIPKIHLDLNLPWTSADHEVVAISTNDSVLVESMNWMTVLLVAYAVIVVLLLVRLGSNYLVTRTWCQEALVCDDEASINLLDECVDQLSLTQKPEIRFCERIDSPVITGLLKPVLLLPHSAETWHDETLRMVMLHELGHVQRRDLWASLVGQVACALHWFNPLVWLLRKRLTHECEYACDAHVISSGAQPRNYINALCDVAEACHDLKLRNSSFILNFSATLAMANQASLKNRVSNLLEKSSGLDRLNTIIVVMVLGVSASAALAINLVRPSVELPRDSVPVEAEVLPIEKNEVDLRLSANPFPSDE